MTRGPLNKDRHWSSFFSSRSVTAFQSRALWREWKCALSRPVLVLTQRQGAAPGRPVVKARLFP